MTTQTLAQAQVLAHLVTRGIDRAYAAAEAVAQRYPDVSIDVLPNVAESLLIVEDCEASSVTFILQGPPPAHDSVEVSLDRTEYSMRASLESAVACMSLAGAVVDDED